MARQIIVESDQTYNRPRVKNKRTFPVIVRKVGENDYQQSQFHMTKKQSYLRMSKRGCYFNLCSIQKFEISLVFLKPQNVQILTFYSKNEKSDFNGFLARRIQEKSRFFPSNSKILISESYGTLG